MTLRSWILVPVLASALWGQQLDENLLKHFTWRSVGPAGAGGRVVDISVAGDSPQKIYIATGGGGIWKSSNEGTTWEPIFEHEDVGATGAVAADPSNPDTVWVGTGEANPRNSVSWGDGVYKSTDGGKTWKHMGLKETQHIGRIRIDPRNPDVVYVAALGHVWGANPERGVYKTTDGGLTWTQSLKINADTGVVDLAMDPHDSNALYAAAYEMRRDGFAGGDPGKQWGPGSGIYKTTDGGRNWRKLSQGLPRGDLGRIGLAIASTNPAIVYAVVQTPTTAPVGQTEEGGPPPPPAGPRTMRDGGIFRSDDRGETWRWVNSVDNRPFYYSQIRVDPANENHVFVLGANNSESDDGGVTFRNIVENIHVDHHALWIDPRNSRHIIDGNDGGVYMTWDGGHSWDFQNQMALSQMYSVDVDMRRPYFIYGGSQDYCSWAGPSATRNQVGLKYADWFKVQTGDGFQVRVDPTDYNIIYAESQNGGLVRHDLHSGRNTSIKPQARSGKPAYRFNWETPVLISSHDSKTLYMGGNFVFKSTDRGDEWREISPELTTEKVGTITAIAESPVDASVLYAGTDDGNIWATRDGKTWKNIASKVPEPGKRWISRLVASRYDAKTVFLAIDGHRSDDFTTYLFKSTDYGETWKSIRGDLPGATPVRVIREDVKNAHLLFAGTESAAYASLDDGSHWVRLMNRMPTTPIADLIVHPRDGDLIAATHGRSFWVMDISPLEELNPTVLSSDAYLFNVKPAIAFDWRVFTNDEFLAEKRFIGENPPVGATISYYLKSAPSGDVKLSILNNSGAVVRDLTATKEQGINRVQWDLRGKALVAGGGRGGRGGGGRGGRGGGQAAEAEAAPAQPAAGGGGRGGANSALVDPGDYVARLSVNGKDFTTAVHVDADPAVTITSEDLDRRRGVITQVMALQAKTEPANTRAESLDTQLTALSKSVDAPAAAKDALASAAKESETVKTEMARINRQISQLFGQIAGSPFAPTMTQRDEFDDLQKDFEKQSAALETLVGKTVPGIEKQLNDAGVPRISVK
jgi:photosystem II stability/assembly factor-like uncharacterized protein